jgi:uncharacterized membrane protein YphA (DoxX/SURF4 family)
MKLLVPLAQLYLRLSLGLGFIGVVAHQAGWLYALGSTGRPTGAPGEQSLFFAGYFSGLLEMALLLCIGILLILGYKTRLAAYCSAVVASLLGLYALSAGQTTSAGSNTVFLAAAAGSCLLASFQGGYRWSLDNRRDKK